MSMQRMLSEVLGYGIIAGSFILKLPQILKLVNSKNTVGLAPSSFYLETLAFTATVVYNVALGVDFDTYGEAVVILMQNYILVALLWQYMAKPPSTTAKFGILAAYIALVTIMLKLPPSLQPLLPGASMLSTISSRVPQILENVKNGHTGQAALITWLLQAGGAMARVFTTMTKVNDVYQLAGYALGASLSLIIVLQIFLYWQETDRVLAAAKKDTKKTK